MNQRTVFSAILVLCGLLWGLGQPLGKISTETGHGQFGLLFWQTLMSAAFLLPVVLLRRRGLPLNRATLTFGLVVGVLGTVVPGSTFYIAMSHLPAGVMAVNIATVPLIALPIAVLLGQDRIDARRLLGLALGMAGVILIAAPRSALPAGTEVAYLLVALVGPLFYAFEGNFVARFGMAGMDAVQAFLIAAFTAAVLVLPLALVTGQFIDPFAGWGRAEWALVGSSAINAVAYSSYVWLAANAGAVFAAQTSYIVTGAGMVWSMILLGERHSPWLWAALAVMLAGVALVQPRRPRRLQEVS